MPRPNNNNNNNNHSIINNNNKRKNKKNKNKNKNKHRQPEYVEFNLSSITIGKYYESSDHNSKLRFRYKYFEGSISIFLNGDRGKIYIPIVDNIEAISKTQSNAIVSIVLTLKKDNDTVSNF